MKEVTGQLGLAAIEHAGGYWDAEYVLKSGHDYPPATGRIEKTYRQLKTGPMTGNALFDDLEKQNWLLPNAGRPYTRGEFRSHLEYMIRKKRLHVLHVDAQSGRPFLPGQSTGEGEEHRALKELVANRPKLIGLPSKSRAELEHSFLSGDRVDVKFDLPNGTAAVVEVETVCPLPGAHQAVKYRALLEVERSEMLGSGSVQAILVAHRFDAETRHLAKKYEIKLVELKA